MKKLGGITPVGGALEDALREFGLKQSIKERELFVNWKDIAGATIARHSEPERFADGKLWIHVPNAVWRQELSLMHMELIARLNRALGEDIVREIVFR